METNQDTYYLVNALEALLFTSENPVSLHTLSITLGVSENDVSQALLQLNDIYEGKISTQRESGIQLRASVDGYQLISNPRFYDLITTHISKNQSQTLSTPALETLAVIAYKQPVSRATVASIRGVNVDGVVRTLRARGLIEEVDISPTGASLYGTTHLFLDMMNISSLDDLPPLTPHMPDNSEIDTLAEELS
ncbi:MAG: SMC-Scp complex subunit ScpB [Actinomycetaceae bacterium]|nr:SMC-Scp complex subunit ScpB [Actinomycetaceae bacterium]